MKNAMLILITFTKFILSMKSKKEYILFSESKYYRNHFEKLIEKLNKNPDSDVHFFTSDYDEYIYFQEKVNSYYTGQGIVRYLIFKYLNCENFILTLTDIGNNLPRSKNCNNYIYFFHGLVSTHKVYTKEAFKNYNTIFTVGPYQEKELILAEKNYNLAKKKIINIGYFYLDYLLKKVKHNLVQKGTILFAPSWSYNKKNFFDNYGEKLIKNLLNKNYSVIMRPHSEHFKRSKNTIKKIIDKFDKVDNFFFDDNISNISSMEKSEILITDNSGIMLEFGSVLNRPCLCFNEEHKIHNVDFKSLNIESLEEIFIKNFTKELKNVEVDNIEEHYLNTLKNYDNLKPKIIIFREKYISNLNNSVDAAFDYLTSIKLNK